MRARVWAVLAALAVFAVALQVHRGWPPAVRHVAQTAVASRGPTAEEEGGQEAHELRSPATPRPGAPATPQPPARKPARGQPPPPTAKPATGPPGQTTPRAGPERSPKTPAPAAAPQRIGLRDAATGPASAAARSPEALGQRDDQTAPPPQPEPAQEVPAAPEAQAAVGPTDTSATPGPAQAAPPPRDLAPPALSPPRPVYAPPPDHPGFRVRVEAQGATAAALPEARQGRLRARLLVLRDGSVGRVDVLVPSGDPELDRAAVEGLRRWYFEPARQGGQPVDSHYVLWVRFEAETP